MYRRIDSCAGEVAAESSYYYATWGEADEAPPHGTAPRVVILGSGPNRIGQGIEFDYCCVHAAQAFRALGYEAVMVNSNPETVSTDYDTSDRLYFEPLDAAAVLAVCRREQPEGVVIQFGGQTPLKLASALEDAGIAILGTPFGAVDLAEDRERFGRLTDELGIRVPPWGMAESAAEAEEVAERIGYPVLVRPSYVLGGRAMRICYSAADRCADAMRSIEGRVLVDRFLEDAIELDVDALADGTLCYVAAVMQHVEEAGVHSGDSSCVLPAPSLDPATYFEVCHVVRRLARGLGVVGLLNVQLALSDGVLYVLEANPRASRTVPFASKATGVNLVEAACKLATGVRISELELPPERPPAQVSVKAAVLPFARFPGADPVLGPEMRSTGEVMASARDFPTAFAKAERAAGRPLPTHGTAFLSVRDADKPALIPIAAALAGLGFELISTGGTADALRAARARRARDREGQAGRRPDPQARLRSRRQHAAGTATRAPTATRSARRRSPRASRASRRRPAPPPPCTRSRRRGARGRSRCRSGSRSRRLVPRREQLRVTGREAVGLYTLLRLERGSLDPGAPGQFFMLEAPGRLLPRALSLCLAPPGELAFLLDPVGPGTEALCALERGDRDPRLRPARERLPARRRAAAPRRRRRRPRAASVPRRGARLAACRARLPHRGARRSGRPAPGRRGRRRPRPRHRLRLGGLRRARVRAGADARTRSPRSVPARSSRGKRRWRAATAPVTAAPSRSTAS